MYMFVVIWLPCDFRLFQLLGYKKTDLLGDVVFTLHHHDDMEATMECSRGGEPCDCVSVCLFECCDCVTPLGWCELRFNKLREGIIMQIFY